jgi:type IV pilus assembly protein PilB
MASKFGQLLLWGNLITTEQLEHALAEQRRGGGKIGEILSKLGYITDDDVTRTLAMKYGVPTVNVAQLEVPKSTLDLIPGALARSRRVIPLARQGSFLTCAMEDPTRVDVVREIEFQTGCHIQPALVTAGVMTEALDRLYPEKASGSRAASPARPAAGRRAAVARIVEMLEELPPEKLEYVRHFLSSIRAMP